MEGTYTLSYEDKRKERQIWEYCIVDSQFTDEEKKAKYEEFKKYSSEYHKRRYAMMKAEKGLTVRKREPGKGASRAKKHNSRICDYFGEEVKFGTLIQRLFKLYGSYPEATLEAKKYLRES